MPWSSLSALVRSQDLIGTQLPGLEQFRQIAASIAGIMSGPMVLSSWRLFRSFSTPLDLIVMFIILE